MVLIYPNIYIILYKIDSDKVIPKTKARTNDKFKISYNFICRNA